MVDRKTLQSYVEIIERSRDMAGQTGGADVTFNPVYGVCLVLEGMLRHQLDTHTQLEQARAAKAKAKTKAKGNHGG